MEATAAAACFNTPKRIGKYFRKNILPDHSGADEIEKLGRIVKNGPLWLLWFTFADLSA
jgi:hypothetical protein